MLHRPLLVIAATSALMGCEGAARPERIFTSIKVGLNAACAIDTDGELLCFGEAQAGAPSVSVTAVDLEDTHACAILVDESTFCWDWANAGRAARLGFLEAPPAATYVAVGRNSTCWIVEDGVVECHGSGDDEQTTPPSGPLISIQGGLGHYCGVDGEQELSCWGRDDEGESSGLTTRTVAAFDAGEYATRTIDWEGALACVGGTDGEDNTLAAWSPEGEFLAVAAGGDFCALTGDGATLCRFAGDCDLPTDRARVIGAAHDITCVGLDAGGISCWGWAPDPEEPEKYACVSGDPETILSRIYG